MDTDTTTTHQATFEKIVRLGALKGETYSVYCKVQYVDKRLTISGVEGPMRNGEAHGSCGQIVMGLKAEDIDPAPEWTEGKILDFLNLWKRWQLNDLRAGSPRQEEWLRENPVKAVYPESHYEKACAALAEAGLNPDESLSAPGGGGYKYGSSWLSEDVPGEVLQGLRALPETDKTPAWV